jgi:hypothetical protein
VPVVAGLEGLTDSIELHGPATDRSSPALLKRPVAGGDLSAVTVDVKGEILELKNTINTMVDQLNAFAASDSRGAKSALKASSVVRRKFRALPAPGRISPTTSTSWPAT